MPLIENIGMGGLSFLFNSGICIIIVIIWVIIAFLVGEDARIRRMNVSFWFAFCLLTGIIGCLIYLVLRDPIYQKPEKKEDKYFTTCSECERKVPDDAISCPYCGEMFTGFDDPICSECKRKVPSDANLCPYCGELFEE